MLGEARIPPDARVKKLRQILPLLVGARLAFRPVNVREFRMRVERVGTFIFSGVIINAGGFLGGAAGTASLTLEHVNGGILRAGHLRLREVGKQMLVSTVAVYDDHLFAAVARHFVRSFLQES